MCVLDLQSGIGGMKFSLENGENALFKYNPAGRVPFKDALKCLGESIFSSEVMWAKLTDIFSTCVDA